MILFVYDSIYDADLEVSDTCVRNSLLRVDTIRCAILTCARKPKAECFSQSYDNAKVTIDRLTTDV